jgi:hypothetical protein
MPGTATFFAPFVLLFPDTNAAIIPIRLVQAVLLIFQAVLIGTIARRLFDDRFTGVVAFAITAFYPFLVFYQGLLLSETLFNTYLIAAIASIYWWCDRGMRIDVTFFLSCVLFALATYTKATLTFLPPLLVAAATLRAHNWRLAARVFLISASIYTVLLAPWWLRNYSLLHAFVPFTTSSAENLYLGNNPHNTVGGADWLTNVDRDVVDRLYAISDEVERQHAFSAEAIRYIVENPDAFIQRMGLKFLRFWNIVPNAAEFNHGIYGVISAASFGPVLILSIASALLWRRRVMAFAPLLLLFAYFTVLHMVTIASLRYRLPVEPFLIAFAAAPVAAISRSIFGWRTGSP